LVAIFDGEYQEIFFDQMPGKHSVRAFQESILGEHSRRAF